MDVLIFILQAFGILLMIFGTFLIEDTGLQIFIVGGFLVSLMIVLEARRSA